jgi:hypothetical protein
VEAGSINTANNKSLTPCTTMQNYTNDTGEK